MKSIDSGQQSDVVTRLRKRANLVASVGAPITGSWGDLIGWTYEPRFFLMSLLMRNLNGRKCPQEVT